MAAVVSIARGHDASYPFKRTSAAEGPVITGQCVAGYYLSAVEKCGEAAGTPWFRFEWAHRPASMRRVITGFSEKAIAPFSSRRTQITKTTLADRHEKDRGHAPGQRVLASMGRFANAMTRRAKGPGALDFIALLRGWERASRVAELETLRDPARTMWQAHHAQAPPQKRVLTHAQNSHGGSGGSRRAWNSRRRKNVRSWPPVSRGRKGREQAAALLGANLGQLQTQLNAGAAGD